MERQSKETQSTPLFTTGALFALIWPMLMEQFLSITMGMADTFMVRRGRGGCFQCQSGGQYQCAGNAVICCADGWRSIITSQYLGAQGQRKRSAQCGAIVHGFYDCNVDADGGSLVLHRPILRLVFGAIDADVMRMCETYFYHHGCFRIRLSDCIMQAPRCSGYKATAVSVCLPVW